MNNVSSDDDGIKDNGSGDEKEVERGGAYPIIFGQMCGQLPRGVSALDFLARPPNLSSRSAEGAYAREYVARVAAAKLDVSSASRAPSVLPHTTFLNDTSPAHAADVCTKQQKLFQKLDKCSVEDAALYNTLVAKSQEGGRDDSTPLGASASITMQDTVDPWIAHLERSSAELRANFDALPRSHTVVLEAAVFLIRKGLLNVKGTSHVNVKQARFLMTYAVWLQNFKSAEWIREHGLGEPPWKLDFEVFIHVLIGGAGTGKTTTVQVVDALVDYFHGPKSCMKSAPTITAARKTGGDTVHAMYKLPRGSMLSRAARLSDRVLRAYRRTWSAAISQAIDEISFVPQDMLFQINVRSQEAKRKPDVVMGGLATILSGDFLQLPPVDGRSLATPLDEKGYLPSGPCDVGEGPAGDDERRKQRVDFECRAGYALWRETCKNVTCLSINMRTKGPLADILEDMRHDRLSDDAWRLLQDRQVGYVRREGIAQCLHTEEADPRLSMSPFANNPVTYIFHRHVLRVAQSYCNAVKESAHIQSRLYVSVACDEASAKDMPLLTTSVRRALLEKSNLRYVKNLPGTLGLYRGMRLLLHRKLCVRLMLMNGCECRLEEIIFADEEKLPDVVFAGTPIILKYMPARLLLRALDAQWVLPGALLPPLPDDCDRRGLFLLAPHTDYLTYTSGAQEFINIRRTHFPVTPADARIVYSAQGDGFEAIVVDMAKPPCMSVEDHWLANYVMLSRTSSLEGLLILRLPLREQLTRGAPKYLKDEVDRLLQLEKKV